MNERRNSRNEASVFASGSRLEAGLGSENGNNNEAKMRFVIDKNAKIANSNTETPSPQPNPNRHRNQPLGHPVASANIADGSLGCTLQLARNLGNYQTAMV